MRANHVLNNCCSNRVMNLYLAAANASARIAGLPPSSLPTLQSATVCFELSKGNNTDKGRHLAIATARMTILLTTRNSKNQATRHFRPDRPTRHRYRAIPGGITRLTLAPSGRDRVIFSTVVDLHFPMEKYNDAPRLSSSKIVHRAPFNFLRMLGSGHDARTKKVS